MLVPPKFKNAPGVVALGISSAPSIGTEPLIRSGKCHFHSHVYRDSTDSKSTM